ncbi:hypothetical protein QAD02_021820 [Eretmocerus hayati]|uniref:Uncharacterized protein n=1 Tax=Eretmocerus hayati TaxID=131215 RepID=A0ACC2PRJ4_9HYME|nr:hypothetical protein QAD02_021820 [Eretmocerus hayati]
MQDSILHRNTGEKRGRKEIPTKSVDVQKETGGISNDEGDSNVGSQNQIALQPPVDKTNSIEQEHEEPILYFSWKLVEEEIGQEIKIHLKNIFKSSGLDDVNVLKQHDSRLVKLLQEYVRSQEYWEEIPAEAKYEDYYGGFEGLPSTFEFSPGEIVVLKQVTCMAKTKPPDYWVAPGPERDDLLESYEDMTFRKINKIIMSYNFNGGTKVNQFFGSSLISMLIRCVVENSKVKNKKSNRYELPLQMLSAYHYMFGGRLFYSHLCANFPRPAPTTVHRYIRTKSQPIAEGEIRASGLRVFLDSRQLGDEVWLSEDATRVTSRIQYDSRNNEVVGFVLPTDENSMPKTHIFKATDAQTIVNYFKNNSTSTSLNCYIAQPLKADAPSFCILLFGTDLKFKAEDCLRRWRFLIDALEKEKIKVLDISSDGDARYLKAMRHLSQLGERIEGGDIQLEGFYADYSPSIICIQDIVHLIVKFKTRLFKSSICLPMGSYAASANHLRFITNEFTKDQHLLTKTDFDGADRMNFNAAKKICSAKVIKLLEKIPSTAGTREYLKIMNLTMLAFLSTDLNPLVRTYCSWYGVNFLRLWREWISGYDEFSVVNNFVSLNTYTCLELNAHSLVSILLKIIDDPKLIESFLPWLFGSQPCEGFFRVARSLRTVFARAVNCSVLEAMRISQRLQMLSDILAFDFTKYGERIHFPRKNYLNPSCEKLTNMELCINVENDPIFQNPLSVSSLDAVLRKAKEDAFTSFTKLGMKNVKIQVALKTHIQPTTVDTDLDDHEQQDIDNPEEEIQFRNLAGKPIASTASEEMEEVLDDEERNDEGLMPLGFRQPVQLKDYSLRHPIVKEDDPYLVLSDGHGPDKVVRKTGFIYMCAQDHNKLSSDRLVRVQQSEMDQRSYAQISRPVINSVGKLDEVFIFDWCLFKSADFDGCLIGFVLGFVYKEEKNWTKMSYSKKSVKVLGTVQGKNMDEKIGVQCDWYSLGEERNGRVVLEFDDTYLAGYVGLDQYCTTIPTAILEGHQIFIPVTVSEVIKDLMIKH